MKARSTPRPRCAPALSPCESDTCRAASTGAPQAVLGAPKTNKIQTPKKTKVVNMCPRCMCWPFLPFRAPSTGPPQSALRAHQVTENTGRNPCARAGAVCAGHGGHAGRAARRLVLLDAPPAALAPAVPPRALHTPQARRGAEHACMHCVTCGLYHAWAVSHCDVVLLGGHCCRAPCIYLTCPHLILKYAAALRLGDRSYLNIRGHGAHRQSMGPMTLRTCDLR